MHPARRTDGQTDPRVPKGHVPKSFDTASPAQEGEKLKNIIAYSHMIPSVGVATHILLFLYRYFLMPPAVEQLDRSPD
jgi:hypothetical protein